MRDRYHAMRGLRIASAILSLFILTVIHALAATRIVALSDTMTSIEAYTSGFARGVMRSPDATGVIIENMELIEDDSPGAGSSEKGTFLEEIFKGTVREKRSIRRSARLRSGAVLYMIPKNRVRAKQAPSLT